MAQPNRAPQQTNNPFVEPATLGQFNDRLKSFGLATALSPPAYRLLLERHAKADILRALIGLHNGGSHAHGALAYLTRIVREVHDAVSAGSVPRSDAAEFVEPATLGAANALLTRHELARRPLAKAEFDLLIQSMGRSDLVTALRAVHDGGGAAEDAANAIRHQIETAMVRAARGETATQQRPPEDDLPPASGGDVGFGGTSTHATATRQAPARAGGDTASTQGHPRGNQRPAPAAQRHQTSQPRQQDDVGRAFPDRVQARAYGRNAALCVEATDDSRQGSTLMIEMAPSTGREKEYDWKNGKIRFQLMHKELLEIIAVLYAFAPGVEFKNHGETKVKSLSLENQDDGGKVYIKLVDKDRPMLVLPVTEKDTLATFTGLALGQALKAFPGFGAGDLLMFIRQRVAPHMTAPPQRNNGPRSNRG